MVIQVSMFFFGPPGLASETRSSRQLVSDAIRHSALELERTTSKASCVWVVFFGKIWALGFL